MKVVILAGGYGTRIAEYTDVIPKPMISLGNKPLIWHIMERYARYGHKDFYIALGYKAEVVKDYFLNYRPRNSSFSVDLSSGDITFFNSESVDWKVTLVDTGVDTMTGGRIKRLEPHLDGERFMATYGDGVANIDLANLESFHKQHGRLATLSAVRPNARFGELTIDNGAIKTFEEKPQLHDGWINGGFFVLEKTVLDYIDGDHVMFERDPLEALARNNQLMAFNHEGFWQCMDTKRDHDYLQAMVDQKNTPWLD